jgi:hypothetical protein
VGKVQLNLLALNFLEVVFAHVDRFRSLRWLTALARWVGLIDPGAVSDGELVRLIGWRTIAGHVGALNHWSRTRRRWFGPSAAETVQASRLALGAPRRRPSE